jgi:ASC-1-like (ASCH) protein
MKLHAQPFTQIKEGKKTIESRLYDEKRKQIHAGDEIIFSLAGGDEETLRVQVTDLIHAKSFSALFATEDLALFGYTSLEDSESIYEYYTKDDEAKYGVIGIKFSIVKQEI